MFVHYLLQSIATFAVTLHKVKLLKNLAAINWICSHTQQRTFSLLLSYLPKCLSIAAAVYSIAQGKTTEKLAAKHFNKHLAYRLENHH